ncbi:MAG: hypothetical protein GY799_12365 [Desulfobulbaceae bacterium]|nr:hypothetical protein [Desulfobulbaceae bacterium]
MSSGNYQQGGATLPIQGKKMNLQKRISQVLKGRISNSEFLQKDVAAKIGMSSDLLSQKLNGLNRRPLKACDVIAICDTVGINFSTALREAKGEEMSKIDIFEDGYLKSEFLNPNYKSFVGWSVTTISDGIVGKLFSLLDGEAQCSNYNTDQDQVVVKHFSPQDIPEGELCWFSNGDGWHLFRFLEYDNSRNAVGLYFPMDEVNGGAWAWCVPFLIAGTPEEAEILKDWDK